MLAQIPHIPYIEQMAGAVGAADKPEKTMATTVIEVQDKMIAKISAARQYRTFAMLQSKAWVEARKALEAMEFDFAQISRFINDANDIETLNYRTRYH